MKWKIIKQTQGILHIEQWITSFWVSIPTHLWRFHLSFPSAEYGRWSIILSNLGKIPHEGPCYCHQHWFYFEFVVILVLIHNFHDMHGVIFDTKQDEYNSNLIFLLGAGIFGWTLNSSALYFSGFIHAHAIEFIKSLWDNIFFLGLPYMLWMNM